MGFLLDPVTLFVALLVSMVGAALVLFWAFWINRDEKSLLWLAVGFVVSSVANMLIAGRAALPEFIPTYIGGSVIVLAVSMAWVAARVFNGRPVHPWVLVIGPVAWIIGCNLPFGLDTYEGRVVLVSCLTAAYYFAAAREFLSLHDGLRTRIPLALMIAAHGGLVLLRAFLIIVQDSSGNVLGVPWFGVGMLETLVFIQVIAFLMVSLTKERVEQRLRDAAHTDPLTGLGNRRAFFLRAEAAVAQAARTGAPLSVIVFDLDRFKAINDRLGHPVGDAVILFSGFPGRSAAW
jgi:predicted signal transduction protein with EAL and GGDEF domain